MTTRSITFSIAMCISLATLVIASALIAEPNQSTCQFETSNDYHRLIIPLKKLVKNANSWTGSAGGELAGKPLGFDFEIEKNDEAKIATGNAGTFSVRFILDAENGKNFLSALKKKYNVSIDGLTFKRIHTFEANGDVDARVSPDGLPEKFELVNLHDQANYGEWYLEISQSKSVVAFGEKNHLYREALIKTFSIR